MTVTRITTLMTTNQLLSEINQSQDTLANTEEELSTGKTINQPSDNPYGAALAVQLNGQLSQLNDYNNSITDGQAWVQTGTTAISSMQSEVQRAQELVTEAANGTNSTTSLNDIGAELTQVVQSIKASANTQYNGQYIFSGTNTTQQPYDATGAYQGTGTPVTRNIGPGSQANVSVDISSALGSNISGSSSGSGLLSELSGIAGKLLSNPPDTTTLSGDLTDIQNGVNQLSTLATQLGSAGDQMTMASSTISEMQTSVTSDLSNDQDANMATTMTTYSNEEAALTAALKAGASIVQTSLMNFLANA